MFTDIEAQHIKKCSQIKIHNSDFMLKNISNIIKINKLVNSYIKLLKYIDIYNVKLINIINK
jgi:predicted transglutaminase-like cysteine proteinase